MTASLQLIRDFTDTYLKGNLNHLKELDLSVLEGDKKYGCPGRGFDCDDTNLARAIYVAVFKEAFPDLTEESLKNRIYRGDTINTFRTLMGDFSENYAECVQIYSIPPSLREKIYHFIHIYHSIGNFVPLPNAKTTQTLNTMRSSVWKDYFYRFWCEVENWLEGTPTHEKMDRLLAANSFALQPYREMSDGFSVLSERLMLEAYANKSVRPFFPRWTIRKKIEQPLYITAVEHYVEFCLSFIELRSERIIEKLAQLL